jgi:hypothetical protein
VWYVQELSPEGPNGWEAVWCSPAFVSPEGLQDMVEDMNTLRGDDPYAKGHYRVIQWEEEAQ